MARWITKISNWFLPSNHAGISNSELAEMRMMVIYCVTVIAILSVYIIGYEAMQMHLASLFTVFSLIPTILALFLIKRSFKLARLIFVIMICEAVLAGLWVTGGVNSPLLFWVIAMPFAMSLVHSIKMAYYVSFLFSIVICMLYYFDSLIYYPYKFDYDTKKFIAYASFDIALFVFSFFTSVFMQKSNQIVEVIRDENDTLKSILENVQSGFLVINRQGIIQPGYSRATRVLFGKEVAGKSLSGLIAVSDAHKEHLDYCFEQIFDDTLPEKVSLAQTGVFFRYYEKYLSLAGSILRDNDKEVTGVLYTIKDATNLMQIEFVNQKNAVLLLILSEKEAFLSFLDSAKDLLSKASFALQRADMESFTAILHTLKGNAAVFGLNKTANLIHDIESYDYHGQVDIDAINQTIEDFLDENQDVINISYREKKEYISLDQIAIAKLKGLMQQTQDPRFEAEFAGWVVECRKRLLYELLRPYKTLVVKLQEEYKKPAKFVVKVANERLDVDVWARLSPHLPALLRNSFYHGLEDARGRASKSPEALIEMRVRSEDGFLHLEMVDDGRGVDPDLVRGKLLEKGLMTKESLAKLSDHEVIQEIFRSGFSTVDEADAIAGRGLGVYALKTAVEEMGGRVEVFSKLGEGTRFVIALRAA